MMVVAAQYSASPAGKTIANHANISGIIHCIIVFICACCDPGTAVLRLVEMRCCSHDAAKMSTARKMFPVSPRSMKRKCVLSGIAD